MRFSICMAAKNAEPTIENAIHSILKQSFSDYELIIVDDCSQDRTFEIANSYKDERIKVYKAKYEGLLKTRAQTMEIASGEYIITVDSDDELVDGALEKIDALLAQTCVDILNFKGIKIFDSGKQIDFPNLFPDKTILNGNEVQEIFDSLVIKDDFTTLWNKAVRRSCINIEKIKECPNLSIGEDNIIQLFTFPNINSYCYSTECLYLYRFNGGITKKFRRDSYSNQKKRMACKKFAIEIAGYNYSKYQECLSIMNIEMVSKICAYYPTIVEADYESRMDFYSCMEEICEDKAFWEEYKKYKTKVRLIYRVPLWMVKNKMYRLVMSYKNICAKLRK